jgi:carbonic anhydrase
VTTARRVVRTPRGGLPGSRRDHQGGRGHGHAREDAACSSAATAPAPTSGPSVGASVAPTAAHWSYPGAEGPANWGDLDPAYAACADGKEQSPIDITGAVKVDTASPAIAYVSGPSSVTNNGHSVEAAAGPGSSTTFAGSTYALVRMHFHSSSETTVDGVRAPVELHFAHESADGRAAVLAVFVQVGAENPAWGPFVAALSTAKGGQTDIAVDWSRLLPAPFTTYQYAGSLTTPPCTEGVQWLVSTVPVQMSPAQVDAFSAAYSGNDRPTQPLNGRKIELDAQPAP